MSIIDLDGVFIDLDGVFIGVCLPLCPLKVRRDLTESDLAALRASVVFVIEYVTDLPGVFQCVQLVCC